MAATQSLKLLRIGFFSHLAGPFTLWASYFTTTTAPGAGINFIRIAGNIKSGKASVELTSSTATTLRAGFYTSAVTRKTNFHFHNTNF